MGNAGETRKSFLAPFRDWTKYSKNFPSHGTIAEEFYLWGEYGACGGNYRMLECLKKGG